MLSRQRTTAAAGTALAGLLLAAAPAVAHSAAPTAAPSSAVVQSMRGYCGYYDFSKTTRRGDVGNRVKEVQCIINGWAGGEVLDVDGEFGPRTASWVVDFQEMNGLRGDGVVGPETWAALRSL
ncbi:peptidoglycan-binding protein [Streptomyces piniterrae]|uniref:Peptidoglycan-binding protein n=1 Tax=Streptomyces piniterrae TaxID=2571125 RepID=A0A4U0NDP6_9ACTN|nr:peptidoglycan-binding domain-containing protein [Streptomyces piniterrae]TJZ52175.1 peptidoglycan-binding protein [Streptomyces piniterrae]